MPFALLIIGAVLLVAGARGTQDQLFDLLKRDFTEQNGQPSFTHWMVAILILGALGYIQPIQKPARAMLALVIVILFIKNGGVFDKFNKQIFASSPSGKGTQNQ